jgi:hypothetical protein
MIDINRRHHGISIALVVALAVSVLAPCCGAACLLYGLSDTTVWPIVVEFVEGATR